MPQAVRYVSNFWLITYSAGATPYFRSVDADILVNQGASILFEIPARYYKIRINASDGWDEVSGLPEPPIVNFGYSIPEEVFLSMDGYVGTPANGQTALISIPSAQTLSLRLRGYYPLTPSGPLLMVSTSSGTSSFGGILGFDQAWQQFPSTFKQLDVDVIDIGSNTRVRAHYPQPSLTLQANPPASGTVYQNTNPIAIDLVIPVTLNPTSTANATATLSIGPSSSSLYTADTETAPAGLTAGFVKALKARVPPQWYYELTLTNASAGTAVALPAE